MKFEKGQVKFAKEKVSIPDTCKPTRPLYTKHRPLWAMRRGDSLVLRTFLTSFLVHSRDGRPLLGRVLAT